jgi:hypothetical protein
MEERAKRALFDNKETETTSLTPPPTPASKRLTLVFARTLLSVAF